MNMKCSNCGSNVPDGLTICNVCKKPVISIPSDNDTVMCPCCGESNFKGIAICSKCGTSLVSPANEPPKRSSPKIKKKARLNPKFVAVVIIIFVVIVAAAAIIISVLRKGDSEPKKVMSFFSASENYTAYVADGKQIYNLTGLPTIHSSSLDGTVEAVISGNGTLRCIESNGVTEVAEKNVVSCVTSQDGGKIAYLVKSTAEITSEQASEGSTSSSDDDTDSSAQSAVQPASLNQLSEYSLFLFDRVTGESSHIANNVNSGFIALSPDGKSVAYTIGTSDASSFESYICCDGIYTSSGKNTAIVALTSDNSYTYYLKYETNLDREVVKLFVKNADSETKLGEFADLKGVAIYLSSDCSQAIFTLNGDDGNFFISVNGSEKKKLSTGFAPVFSYGNALMPCEGAVRTFFCPTATFAGLVFTDSASVVRSLDEAFACIDVSDNSTDVRTVSDSSAVYYLDTNEYLYFCPVSNITKAQQIADHVTAFDVSKDNKKLYYINGDSELHCVSGDKDNLISNNVYKMWLSTDGTVYFLESYSKGSGTLFYSANGAEKSPVAGADNVLDVITDYSESIYYRSDYSDASGSFDLWYCCNGESSKIIEDIG